MVSLYKAHFAIKVFEDRGRNNDASQLNKSIWMIDLFIPINMYKV